jgi:hypothetical protein
MSFCRPDEEGLLGQVFRVGLRSREAHREPVKRFVVLAQSCGPGNAWIGCVYAANQHG